MENSTSSQPPPPPAQSQFHTGTCRVYDKPAFQRLIRGIRVSACMISEELPVSDEASVVRRAETLAEEEGFAKCSSCSAGPFETRAQQTAHYKQKWHTQNLRRRLLGRPSLSLAEFAAKKDDISSDSDTDSDTGTSQREISPLLLAATRHCRAYFTNSDGRVLSVYRCLLHHKKEWIGADGVGEKWVEACKELTHDKGWAVIMCAGGHFAGAIFKGESDVAIKHKTFHSYVTRRGQGKAQGTRDSKGGNAPRSAGASLRRYNQEQFAEHIREILIGWKDDLAACSLILYRAVGPLNKASLFGAGSPLTNKDPRLRTLPFPTRRPTFKEVRRAHNILTTVEIYENVEAFQKAFGSSNANSTNSTNDRSGRKPQKASPIKIDRAKSREKPPRPCPTVVSSSEDDGPCYIEPMAPPNWTKILSDFNARVQRTSDTTASDVESAEEKALISKMGKVNFKDATEEISDASNKQNKDRKNKNRKEKSVDKDDQKGKIVNSKSAKKGVIKVPAIVKKLWQSIALNGDFKNVVQTWDGAITLEESLNVSDPADGNTVLHKAAVAELPDIVTQLLELGADPCCRNLQLQTPYCVTNHQETRIAFRLFQGLHPDKYQYAKANIPGPLTLEMLEEEKEKKAAAKRLKRQKDKEKQQEKVKTFKFLELNDKQKIAACTENRCFTCGGPIKGVPFTYDDNRFCNIKCLQNHRNARPLKLSAQ